MHYSKLETALYRVISAPLNATTSYEVERNQLLPETPTAFSSRWVDKKAYQNKTHNSTDQPLHVPPETVTIPIRVVVHIRRKLYAPSNYHGVGLATRVVEQIVLDSSSAESPDPHGHLYGTRKAVDRWLVRNLMKIM